MVKCNVHWRSKIIKYPPNTSGLFFLHPPRPAGTYNGRAQKQPRFPTIQKQFIQHHWERKNGDRFNSGTQHCQPQKRGRAVFADRVTQTSGTLAVDLNVCLVDGLVCRQSVRASVSIPHHHVYFSGRYCEATGSLALSNGGHSFLRT